MMHGYVVLEDAFYVVQGGRRDHPELFGPQPNALEKKGAGEAVEVRPNHELALVREGRLHGHVVRLGRQELRELRGNLLDLVRPFGREEPLVEEQVGHFVHVLKLDLGHDDVGDVHPENFRGSRIGEDFLVFFLVHFEAVAVCDSPGAALPLNRAGLGDLLFFLVVHLGDLVEVVLRLEARVEHVVDIFESDGGLGYFGRQDDSDLLLERYVGVEHLLLLSRLQPAVELFEVQAQLLVGDLEGFFRIFLLDELLDFFDLFDGGEEDQDVGLEVAVVEGEVLFDVLLTEDLPRR